MRLLALRAETMEAMRRLKLPCDDITPIGLWGSDMYLIGVNNEQFEVLRLWNVQTEDVTPATLRDLQSESPAIPTSPSAGNAASGARSSASRAPIAAPSPSFTAPPERPVAAPARQAPVHASAPARIDRHAEPALSAPVRGQSAVPDIKPAMAGAAQPAASPTSPMPAPDLHIQNGSPNIASIAPSSPDRRDGPALTLESNVSGGSGRASRADEARGGKGARGAEPDPKSAAKEPAREPVNSNAGKLRMTVDGEHLYAEIKGGKIVLMDRTYDSLAHARDSIRRERNKVATWEYFDEGVKAWRVLNRD